MIGFKVHLIWGDAADGERHPLLLLPCLTLFYQWFGGNILLLTKFGSGMKIGGIYNVMTIRQCGLLSDLG